MTHLDLFSGIGGFAIAAQACGYMTVGFCEKEPYAQQILIERFNARFKGEKWPRDLLADAQELQRNGCEHHAGSDSEKRGQVSESGNGSRPRLHPDIFTLNGADYAGVDLLTGGFPCQPFSVAGKRRGAEDDRALWPEMLRVIDGAKPAWLIGENVAGIVTMELDNILSDLEAIGYAAWPLVIPACAVDARHRRDRVWIVAHRQGEGLEGHRQRRNARGIGGKGQCAGKASSNALTSSNSDLFERRDDTGNELRGEELSKSSDSGGIDGRTISERECCEWLPEPELGRVAHGIPNRAHRLRGLGNAIVPQVAFEIIRAIAKTTRAEKEA